MGRYWLKLHHSTTGELVAAVCDQELLGKRIDVRNGLTVEVAQSFYGGNLLEEDQVFEHIEHATIVNLVGNEIVERAVKRGLAHSSAAVKLGGVSHLQIYY